ncbi:MAG: UDP-N-acetylmuramoyl-L-alanyl-D-glutamate--2,6-diaminopimelate ligase [Holosporaceae bacterium]|nr:UDP-N-acetylmuramoyl-L-alanyl-D-glutamate--2,6-diaminopimelate ligase [Holosporaceae bacterium]
MKKLRELLARDHLYGERIVVDLCDNSEQAVAGSMFGALSKDVENRKIHIDMAIARGAQYILQEGENNYTKIENGVLFFFIKNVRAEWACIVSKFFTSSFENTVAITGTNGKSSTLDILRQIWIGQGIKAASIGTLGVITKEGCEELPHQMTSPDCLELNKILWRLCQNGIKNVALEATSHGIAQHRVDEIGFDICAFTNFTQDHLDYHKTFENYWNSKARLFSELAVNRAVFVVNDDDLYAEKIREIARHRGIKCVGYGYNSSDVKIIEVSSEKLRQSVKVSFGGREFSYILPLPGVFQVHNSLCAATISYFSGIDMEKILERLQQLRPIRGRLELVCMFRSAHIYIDYAHTPDALRNAILSLRNYTRNRIITVFGCGGNRDPQKRILMGEIAEKFSDIVIISDDNPRNEDPELIRKMILAGCPHAIEIADRKIAIEFAMEMLSDGDTLLIAGKGHETNQQVGKELLEFSDKEVVLKKAKIEK